MGAAALVGVHSCSLRMAVAAADMDPLVGVHTAAGRAPAVEVHPNLAAAAAGDRDTRLAGILQVVGMRTCY